MILALLQAAPAEALTQEAASHAFEPILLSWIVLLPLIGFLVNGAASMIAARRNYHDRLSHLPAAAHGDHAADPVHGDVAADPSDAHARPVDHSRDAGVDDQEEAALPHVAPPAHGWTHTLPSFVAPGVLLGAFVLALLNFLGMRGADLHDPIVQTYFSWIPVGDLQIDAALLLDPLSVLMVLIITGVGFLIHLFSVGYMSHDPGYPRYMAYLNLFVFFMLILVLGASYPLMFVGWEGVGLCSYLLIGFWFAESANADAGKKAFIVNRIGDFGFLMAMMLLFANVGTLSFPEVFDAAAGQLPYAGAVVTVVALFLFLGATGKSAQIPLYVWLPDAMAGPTPVSALIHAATMVTAGVYMIVRSSTIFAMAPSASLLVAVVGTLTALFAATIGLKQWDIKKVLAYSTVSQLGFMVAAVGMGAYVAGVFHLMTHAFFKACLFLGAGAVIHAMHEALHATHSHRDAQDMRNMGGLRGFLPVTFATMGVATLAIAGVPPFAGFFSKDEIVGAAWLGAEGASPFSQATLFGISGAVWMGLIGVVLTITAFITAFYMGRMMLYTFFGPNRTGDTERRHLHEVGWTMTVPLVVLALLSLVGGWFNIEPEVPIVNWFTPVAIGGPAALHHWLHPAIEGAEAVYAANAVGIAEAHHYAWPIVLAIVVGLAGLLLAVFLLKPGRLGTAEAHPAYAGGFDRLLYHKWYVDELYDAAIVRPVYSLSRGFSSIIDRGLIDGIVDGSGRLTQGIGLMVGRLQTGHLNTYAFMLLMGVIAVLGAFVAF